jgi:hypothetical protein
VESVLPVDAVKAVRYLEPKALVDIPMDELYWPYALASLHDRHLRDATRAAATGLVPWKTFSSALETGPFEFYVDRGLGFTAENKLTLPVRRNRFGLSYARAVLRDDAISRIRLDPATEPCLLRLDWVEMRCRVHGSSEPVVVRLDSARDIERLAIGGGRRLAPNVVLSTGHDLQVIIDVEQWVGAKAYEARVSCGFAVLAIPPTRMRRWRDGARARLAALARRRVAGLPLRAARRIAR